MIKMLHFADTHVGMENYGQFDPVTGTSSRVRDFLFRIDEVIDYALNEGVDLAVFAGDAFKNRDPDPTQQREFSRRVKRLADEVPVLLLVGNHDMPGMSSRATSVDIFSVLDVANVIVGRKHGTQVVQTRQGPVFLAWMPYPMRNRLLTKDEHRGKSVDELELALREVTMSLIDTMAEEAASHDMPRVLAGHFSVDGATLGSEKVVMLGKDVAVSLSTLADDRWDYVALGHIHKHQDVNRGRYPSVVYSGSLERIDFGEEKEDKGFCWVSLARGQTTWDFVPVHARAFQTVRADVIGSPEPTEVVLDALARYTLEGKVVRVIVKLDAAQLPLLRENEIQAALVGSYSYSLQKDVQHVARARLGGLNPETLSPIALTERYFVDRDQPPARIERLLERADKLINPDNE